MAAEVSHGAETAEKASMLWRRPCVGGVDGEAMRALCQLGAGGDAEERLTQEAVELRWEGHGLVARAPAGREVDTSRDIVVRLRRQGERGVRSGSSGADERWLGSGLGLGLRGLRRAAGGGRRMAGGGLRCRVARFVAKVLRLARCVHLMYCMACIAHLPHACMLIVCPHISAAPA